MRNFFSRNKFSNVKVVLDGIKFASKREAARYLELKLLERTGEIKDLKLQPRFTLLESFTDNDGAKHRKIEYVADFMYREDKKTIVEDAKGFKTRDYILKKKFFLASIIQKPSWSFREV